MSAREETHLRPEIISRLQALELRARGVVEGFISGLHRSPYHGFSLEFAEHREYSPGDDLKHLDWKVQARTDRYYVKQYEEETNLRCTFVLDSSRSMLYSSNEETKLDYARLLCASLGFLLARQGDSVGLVSFDSEVRFSLPPTAQLRTFLEALASVEPGEEPTGMGKVLHEVAESTRKKGLVVLVSDLIDDAQEVISGLHHLRHGRHEVIVAWVLDPAERSFPFEAFSTFRGLERENELSVDPLALKQAYLEVVRGVEEELSTACAASGVDLVRLLTTDDLATKLSAYLADRARRRA